MAGVKTKRSTGCRRQNGCGARLSSGPFLGMIFLVIGFRAGSEKAPNYDPFSELTLNKV